MRVPGDRAQLDAEIGHAHAYPPRPRSGAHSPTRPGFQTPLPPSYVVHPPVASVLSAKRLACPWFSTANPVLLSKLRMVNTESTTPPPVGSGRPTPTRFVALSLMTELLRNVDDAHFASCPPIPLPSTAASATSPAFVSSRPSGRLRTKDEAGCSPMTPRRQHAAHTAPRPASLVATRCSQY